MKLIQCVPNFSEGKDKSRLEAIVAAIKTVPGVFVMDVEMDPNHNRSVVTFFGGPEGVAEAAFRATKKAMELIDMRSHKGEHPRMGATDVVPFTPVFGSTMVECVEIANIVGRRIARELHIPVYLYGEAAQRAERANLANVRKGEFEGLSKEMGTNPNREPDFGKSQIHPTAGATAVGAREQIINFNVNLDSSSMEIAKSIAKAIRTSSGGLPHLRAKEIELSDRKQVQVSTVLTNFKETDLFKVFSEIEKKAKELGASVEESELIGLVPMKALADFARDGLRAKTFKAENQILELKLIELLRGSLNGDCGSWGKGLESLCEALSSERPVPGGGSASAALAAIGSSLIFKVFSLELKKLVKSGGNEALKEKLVQLIKDVKEYRTKFLDLAQKDADSYDAVVRAYKMEKTHASRPKAIEQALENAALVPLELFKEAIRFMELVSPKKNVISANIVSDFKVGLQALQAGRLGAKENVLINLDSLKDEVFIRKTKKKLSDLEISLKRFVVS